MVGQRFWFGCFVWIVLSIFVFKSFSSIFSGCLNKSTKYLENSSFAPDQRIARACRNKDKLVKTSSYKSILIKYYIKDIKKLIEIYIVLK